MNNDTWNEIQNVRRLLPRRRDKMARQRRERERLMTDLSRLYTMVMELPVAETANALSGNFDQIQLSLPVGDPASVHLDSSMLDKSTVDKDLEIDPELENMVCLCLCDFTIELPSKSAELLNILKKTDRFKESVTLDMLEAILQKLAYRQLVTVEDCDEKESEKTQAGSSSRSALAVVSVYHDRLLAVTKEVEAETKTSDTSSGQSKVKLEQLLTSQTAKEREQQQINEEIMNLLKQTTVKERFMIEKFKTQGGTLIKPFCMFGTREFCQNGRRCPKLHFRKVLQQQTDPALGDCSFLNTCFHVETCKYIHYEIEPYQIKKAAGTLLNPLLKAPVVPKFKMMPPQWLQCDLRTLEMSVLGKFAVVMLDPPWDIHMELPYGTMQDDEMRRLPVPALQDDGLVFLWVTGRSMELGRNCLRCWGYERVDELVWVKTNQLQRIIRTGRTGHWLNHGKEHCIIGGKGNWKQFNLGIDCDILVTEVRATSHKPDEIYGIIERLAPGRRKIELFGRPHNIQPNWITLGNQLDGVRLLEPDVVERFKRFYPDGNCMKPVEHRTARRYRY